MVTPWFLSPSFCLWSPGRPEQSLGIRSPAYLEASDLRKKTQQKQNQNFSRRTTLRCKSSPFVWQTSGPKPHFPRTAEIFLGIFQSCSTTHDGRLEESNILSLHVSLQGYFFCSQTLPWEQETRSALFVSSESPSWGWSQEAPTLPVTGNEIHLRPVSLGKEEEEGRKRLDKGWGRSVYLLRHKFFKPRVTHHSPEVHSSTGEGFRWRGDTHTHSQLLTGSLQSL